MTDQAVQVRQRSIDLRALCAPAYCNEVKAVWRAGITPGHAHDHALRVLAKRVLRDLWVAWRNAPAGKLSA